MEPTIDGGDNCVRVLFPDEGFGVLIVLRDEAVDGGLKLGHGAEHAVFESAPGEFGEKAFDGVEP